MLPTRWDGCEAMEAELGRAGPGSLRTEIAARAFRCWQDAIEEHAAEDAGGGGLLRSTQKVCVCPMKALLTIYSSSLRLRNRLGS